MQQNLQHNKKNLAAQLHKYRSQISLLGLRHLSEITNHLEIDLLEKPDSPDIITTFAQVINLSNKALQEVPQIINKLKNQ